MGAKRVVSRTGLLPISFASSLKLPLTRTQALPDDTRIQGCLAKTKTEKHAWAAVFGLTWGKPLRVGWVVKCVEELVGGVSMQRRRRHTGWKSVVQKQMWIVEP